MAKKQAEAVAPEVQEVETDVLIPDAEIAAGVAPEENGEVKKQKKLGKKIDYEKNEVVINVLGGTGEKRYCTDDLPEEIQTKLVPFGGGHKLGDAAAGKEGLEAEEAIQKVWDGLMANDWTVRAPAGPKVSMKELQTKFQAMDAEEQKIAASLFEKLGIKLG